MRDDDDARDTEAFTDFNAFGFRKSENEGEPGLLDAVGAFVLGALSRGERDPIRCDRENPRLCANIMKAQAARFPHAPTGRSGSEVAPLGKAFTALAQLYDMRAHVKRAGPIVFDAPEAARLRRVASSNISIAAAERARVQRADKPVSTSPGT